MENCRLFFIRIKKEKEKKKFDLLLKKIYNKRAKRTCELTLFSARER